MYELPNIYELQMYHSYKAVRNQRTQQTQKSFHLQYNFMKGSKSDGDSTSNQLKFKLTPQS